MGAGILGMLGGLVKGSLAQSILSVVGGYVANELANNMFGKDPSMEENAKESAGNMAKKWILRSIRKYIKWI